MLDPDDRHLLVDALKPPPGMTLDVAVGTTFTLDLEALLLAPVSFAFFGHTTNGSAGTDPLALLESVRRHADRITVFCQSGCIAVPRTLQPVLAWLEDAVVPVAPPGSGRLFHPKVWVLRFVDDHATTTHRVLVSSRNLTFDTSWDTIVRLDQAGASDVTVDNQPLADFIGALTDRAVQPPDPGRIDAITDLADSITDVSWELPDGCTNLAFWPLGLTGADMPSLEADRALVVSPFLSTRRVHTLAAPGDGHLLVSRPESLDEVGGDAVTAYTGTYVLDTDAIQPDTTDDDDPTAQPSGERVGSLLDGLHAKLYLLERGDTVHLLTGSPNATDAGFGGNIEFAVELTGSRADWGIDATLDARGHRASLRDMLRPYTPMAAEPTESDDLAQLTYRLDTLVQQLAAVPFTLHVQPVGDDYHLHLTSDRPLPDFDDDYTITARPASVGAGSGLAVTCHPGTRIDHDTGLVTLAGITSFIAITATARLHGSGVHSTALANARLIGAPADRKERLLSTQIASTDDLIRYLLFLLYDLTDDTQLDQLVTAFGAGTGRWGSLDQIPLLETMLRALVHHGDALDRVADLLADLQATDDGTTIIPTGLTDIWAPIDEVRHELT